LVLRVEKGSEGLDESVWLCGVYEVAGVDGDELSVTERASEICQVLLRDGAGRTAGDNQWVP
jgi:hypothetical protein